MSEILAFMIKSSTSEWTPIIYPGLVSFLLEFSRAFFFFLALPCLGKVPGTTKPLKSRLQ
jgi:hypothetical protein